MIPGPEDGTMELKYKSARRNPLNRSDPVKIIAVLAACLPAAAQGYVVSTVAGGAPAPAVASAGSLALGSLGRVATNPSGTVFFTALHSVYRLDSGGTVTRVAGSGRPGFSGDGGPATSAQLNSPTGLAIDTQGRIYIADTANQRVRVVIDRTITTFAGNGTAGSAGDFGDPTRAQLHLPLGLTLDSAGNLYIADSANNVIREVSNGIITTFAGNHIAGFSHDNESATVAALNSPSDISFDPSGNLYVADTGNGRVRQISAAGVITTFAGGGTVFTEGGLANGTPLSGPHGVAVDSGGNVLIADTDANRIRKVANGVITTVAGQGGYGFAGDGNAATNAQMNTPSSIAEDPSGNLYVVDLFNARIRKISPTGTISTVAGNGLTSYSGDGGSAQNALMNGPFGVAAGAGGAFYISDTNNQRVRLVAADGTISTVAGNGTPGFGGDGSSGASAQLSFPGGLAVDP